MILPPHMSATLGAYRPAVDAALADLARDQIVARIWAHDHTVWRPDPGEITNRLGWLHAAETMRPHVADIQAFAASLQAKGIRDVLLLGMGGSSLAPEVFAKVFARPSGPSLAVLDTTDPATVLAHADRLDPRRTLFIISTKSGGTVETLSALSYFYGWAARALGEAAAGQQFVAITDPGSRLVGLAEQHRFRRTFLNDPNIGGRFSALSFFGLVPAAIVGVDLETLLDRAEAMARSCGAPDRGHGLSADGGPGARLGAIMAELAKAGRDKLTLVTSAAIASFTDWVEQLVAESTGKDGKGILPVVGEPLAGPSAYGDDRLFVHLHLAGDESLVSALQALEMAGHPVVRLELADAYDLGGHFFLWEMATAIAGHRLGIHPFDQPDVEAAKHLARQMIAAYRSSGALPGDAATPLTAAALRAFLAQSRPGAYLALQAYLPPTARTDAALLDLRLRLRDRLRQATTVGYGPRFLHSTGQLHKGDAGNGLFIQLTADDLHDVPIPDEPGSPHASISFGVLKRAQALGDKQALHQAGRRVIRFRLGDDVPGGLARLAGAIGPDPSAKSTQ